MLRYTPPHPSLTNAPPSQKKTHPLSPVGKKMLSGFPRSGVGPCRPDGSSAHGGDAVLGQGLDCQESVPVAEPLQARRGDDSAGLQARKVDKRVEFPA